MEKVLWGNSASIPFDDQYFTSMPAVNWTGDDEELRAMYRRHGVVLVRNLLDRERLSALRQAYLSRVDPRYFHTGTTVVDAIHSGWRTEEDGIYGAPGHPAHAFVRSSDFLAFAESPLLYQVATTLLGPPVERLRRTPWRHFLPGQANASRAHIDFSYLDRGSPDVVTFWIPIGDCDLSTGGLIYLEGSAGSDVLSLRSGLPSDRPEDRRPLTHDLRALADKTGGRWWWANYRAGDVAIHSPFIVHASLNNQSERMRISTDIRFRRADRSPDMRWNDHWCATDGH